MRWIALTLGLAFAALVFEAAMVTSQVNRALPRGRSLGAYNLEMGHTWTVIVSTAAALLAGWVLIRLATHGPTWAAIGLPMLLAGMGLVRLFCGHVLAYPQNSWLLAFIFVAAVVLTIAHTEVGRQLMTDLRGRLSPPATTP